MAKDVADPACAVLGVKSQRTTDKTPLAGGLPMGYEDYLHEAVPEMSARHKVSPDIVRHLISYYGSRAEKVLELIEMGPSLVEPISPESIAVYILRPCRN
jgi:glycerol-3-phosphate dehydrogenase